MMDLEELKRNKTIKNGIDWELTPQEAFEAYQIKTAEGWRYRSLPDTYYFLISVYKGDARVLLVKRTYKDSEDIAEIGVPSDLLKARLEKEGGDKAPVGHYPVGDEIMSWIRKELR